MAATERADAAMKALEGAEAAAKAAAASADAAADSALDAQALAQAPAPAPDAAAPAGSELSGMSLAEACALVRINPADALGFKDHGTHVVVVTAAGQKLSTAA